MLVIGFWLWLWKEERRELFHSLVRGIFIETDLLNGQLPCCHWVAFSVREWAIIIDIVWSITNQTKNSFHTIGWFIDYFFSGIYLLTLVGARTARENCLCSSIAWWPWNVSNEQSIIKLYSYCWISRLALHYSIMWCVRPTFGQKMKNYDVFFLTSSMYRPRIHLNHSFVARDARKCNYNYEWWLLSSGQ